MSQQSFFQSITKSPQNLGNFVREARDELRKVSWPSRQQTLRYTVIVVIACLAVSAFIGVVDYLLTILLEKFI